MATGGFHDALAAQLGELQQSLSMEHRRAVQRLETKISALEMENSRLFQKYLDIMSTNAEQNEPASPRLVPSSRRRASTVSNSVIKRVSQLSQLLNGSTPDPTASTGSLNQFASPVVPVQPNEVQVISPSRARTIHSIGEDEDDLIVESQPTDHVSFDTPPPQEQEPATPGDVLSGDGESYGSESSDLKLASEARGFDLLDAWATHHRSRSVTRRLDFFNPAISRMSVGSLEEIFWADTCPALQKLMVHPNSMKRMFWECIALLLVLADVLIIPLSFFAFPDDSFIAVEIWITRLYWTLDFFFSFFTGYVSRAEDCRVEMHFARVAKRYTRTQLPLDCILLTADWVEIVLRANHEVIGLQIIMTVRALRIVQVSRCAQVQHMIISLMEHIHSEVAMISNYVLAILLALLLVIHVIACFWHSIRISYWGGGGARIAEADTSFWDRYTKSFHYVLALFLGEHILDSSEYGVVERCFTIVVLILAFVITAAIVGSLTTAMTRLQIIASQRSAQFAALRRYLTFWGISRKLAMRAQHNAKLACMQLTLCPQEDSVELLSIISDPLRAEIHYEVFARTITAHPLFYLYDKLDMTSVRQICHSVLSEVSISRGDKLFVEFETAVPPKMYFVEEGRLNYIQRVTDYTKVTAPEWISEAALWTTWAHLGTLSASTQCKFVAVDANKFMSVASKFPTAHMNVYAAAFVRRLNKKDQHYISDLGDNSKRYREFTFDLFKDDIDMEELETTAWLEEGRSSMSTMLSKTPPSF